MTHPLRLAENCTTHPFDKAQNLMTHPLSAPAHPRLYFLTSPLCSDYVLFARYLHIPLMDAERAWSHAMELKLLANTELRKKFHYIRRLRKAASHASQLEELCHAEACDARTKLESQVL